MTRRRSRVLEQTRQIIEKHSELRCSLERRKTGHTMVTVENMVTGACRTILCAKTPSDHRGSKNHFANVRRACRELTSHG